MSGSERIPISHNCTGIGKQKKQKTYFGIRIRQGSDQLQLHMHTTVQYTEYSTVYCTVLYVQVDKNTLFKYKSDLHVF